MDLLLRVFCLLLITNCSANLGGHAPAEQPGPFLSYNISAGLLCEPWSGLLGCLRKHEPVDSQGTAEAVRQGDRLCLPVQPEAACFVDGEGLGYALLDRTEHQFVVVETESTGGYTVILVNTADGSKRRVDNRPLYSSDSSLFATVSYDTDAGYIPNRVAVCGGKQADPIYEFDEFSQGEGPTGIRWVGPSKLEVRYSPDPHSADQDGTNTFFVWKDGQGVWKNDYQG